MSIKKTGVFIDPDEMDVVRALTEQASRTPVITFESSGPDFASIAWKIAKERCHKYALSHGLPEIAGYYGLDADGEFVTT